MADIQPFKGYTPRPEVAQKLASLPYDVMSSNEARALVKDNPKSFLRVVKSEVDYSEEALPDNEEVIQKGAENLRNLIANGDLVKSEKPSFYLYRQVMGSHSQVGLVVGVSVEEYNQGLIKKHEFTRKKKEDDRAHHVEVLGAHTGPVFLTYRKKDSVDALANQILQNSPDIDFVAEDGIAHTLWKVTKEDMVKKIQQLFLDVPALYVADGHHRTAAAARVAEILKNKNPNHRGDEGYNHFLAVLFPDEQLKILDYNRILLSMNGHTPDKVLELLSEKFELEDAANHSEAKPSQRGHFALFMDGCWKKMILKPGLVDENDPVHSLDTSILQDQVLEKIFAIADPRTDEKIDFVGGIRGLEELEKRCSEDGVAAFALFPTGIDQLMNIADAGEVMPPKSTWFEPKLRSGMVVRLLS